MPCQCAGHHPRPNVGRELPDRLPASGSLRAYHFGGAFDLAEYDVSMQRLWRFWSEVTGRVWNAWNHSRDAGPNAAAAATLLWRERDNQYCTIGSKKCRILAKAICRVAVWCYLDTEIVKDFCTRSLGKDWYVRAIVQCKKIAPLLAVWYNRHRFAFNPCPFDTPT